VEDRKERDHPGDLGVERQDDIKSDISEVGWKGGDWVDMSRAGTVAGPVNTVMRPLNPQNAMSCLTS
jgi:hypothetical protein